jgi:outer membrane receptor for ferrienterochelin and colicins
MKKGLLLFSMCFYFLNVYSQRVITGVVIDAATREPVQSATIKLSDSASILTDEKGKFLINGNVSDSLFVTATGYAAQRVSVTGRSSIQVLLFTDHREMDAVVVSGTMKPVKRLESPVNVEVYTPQFFKKNPAPSIFESLQNINGVRPQLNCSVCNTGDIHINGLEGPYTMVTIDGMPIVSSLASVYGLFGIPTQLIDRVEIVKGPASGLYGSEAIGGLINIITKSPDKAPAFTANVMATSWQEYNVDLGGAFKIGNKVKSLIGVDYYNFQHRADKNNDQFTDVTLQHRISVFNKLSFKRKKDRVATLAGRYFYEDRWGGDMRWNKTFRGGDSLYGESIYTNRWEVMGQYQLPVEEKMALSFSATRHQQNSYYGATPYMGDQRILFGQLVWDKKIGMFHSLLSGAALRYNYYDDNSTATIDTLTGKNNPDNYVIPGLFLQDEWKLSARHLVLLGLRYDHHPVHKGIFTPRIAWKWSLNDKQVFRLNAGTGFRVVSLFTEDHAALTGARAVEIRESLDPERSYNVNLNYIRSYRWDNMSLSLDASAWYSYFTNQIIADYDTDPNLIVYKNLDGYAASRGFSLNVEFNKGHRFKALAGVTIQDVHKSEKNGAGHSIKTRPVLTEKWSGTWTISYTFPAAGLSFDYTGNLYGPMRLPLLSATDPRPANSPVWSIQNIQCSKLINSKLEVFAGVKNLLNWTPAKSTPFIIARSHDPFDKNVQYDASGGVIATPENPYALSFDPSYVFAPNQGIRMFGGVRYTVR